MGSNQSYSPPDETLAGVHKILSSHGTLYDLSEVMLERSTVYSGLEGKAHSVTFQ